MKALKQNWIRIICIVCISGLISMVTHAILSPVNTASFTKVSIFVEKGMLIPAVIVWEILAFSVFALVFLAIQEKLPGKRWIKGLTYGLSFGGLYFIGMFESVLLLGTSVQSELLMGFTDCLTFVISGALLGIFVGTDSEPIHKKQSVMVVFAIGIFYVIGRYLAYCIVNIQSAIDINPVGTFIWTVCQGIWVGCIYYMLQSSSKEKSYTSHSIYFGVVIYGLNWLMNHLFMYVVLEFSFDLLIRSGIDIVFTTIGTFIFMKYISKMINKRSMILSSKTPSI